MSRSYLISVDGFPGPQRVTARSASAARYVVFRQMREAGYFSERVCRADGGPFRLFLRFVSVLAMGPAQ